MTASDTTVETEVRIEAPQELVFSYFTVPDKMLRWKGVEAQLEPRPGGIYRVVVIPGRAVARGEYVEVVPYSRVVFTWGWEDEGNPVPAGSSTVEVTLTPDGDATIVRLVHRDLPTAAAAAEHQHGWGHYLPRLVIAAAGGDAGPDPNLQMAGPAASTTSS